MDDLIFDASGEIKKLRRELIQTENKIAKLEQHKENIIEIIEAKIDEEVRRVSPILKQSVEILNNYFKSDEVIIGFCPRRLTLSLKVIFYIKGEEYYWEGNWYDNKPLSELADLAKKIRHDIAVMKIQTRKKIREGKYD